MSEETLTGRILVVDDEPNNVEILEKRLRSSGHKTIPAFNGMEALRLAVREIPDLIILDVMMPGMSGYEICRELKSNPVTREIPVLFLTARAEVDDRVEGLQLGASDYISKPFHPRELMARVNNALRQRSLMRTMKEEYDRLQAISIVDELTGLYNRRYFTERFEEEINRAKRYNYPVSCLMIDIDFFKNVNDTYGHLAGDQVLAELALIVKDSTRVVDFVCRFGGEEFVVLLPQTGISGALVVAEKMRRNVEQHGFPVDGRTIPVSVSIGVAVLDTENPGTFEELIRQADEAMYAAKKSGRNQVKVFSRFHRETMKETEVST